MSGQSPIPKKRGPKPKGATGIMVRTPRDTLGALDAWIARQPDAPSRPEAIRRLLAAGLQAETEAEKPTRGKRRACTRAGQR